MTAQELQATTADALAAVMAIAASLEQQTRLLVAEKQEGYVKLATLLDALGDAFSDRMVMDDLRAGYFKLGRDYINLSNGQRPTYAFKISRIRAIYETAPEKRRKYN